MYRTAVCTKGRQLEQAEATAVLMVETHLVLVWVRSGETHTGSQPRMYLPQYSEGFEALTSVSSEGRVQWLRIEIRDKEQVENTSFESPFDNFFLFVKINTLYRSISTGKISLFTQGNQFQSGVCRYVFHTCT